MLSVHAVFVTSTQHPITEYMRLNNWLRHSTANVYTIPSIPHVHRGAQGLMGQMANESMAHHWNVSQC